MTEFVVTRIDSTSKLIEMEDIAAKLAGTPSYQFETVLAGECAMYVARMCTGQAKRDVALLPVYVSATLALAGPTMLGRSYTLIPEITAWARDTLGVRMLLTPSKRQPLVLTETIIKKRSKKTGLPVLALRSTKHGICFKRKVRGKRWNASKGCWINRAGQTITKPKWAGENAFVADFWQHTTFSCTPLTTPPPPPPPPPPVFDATSPMLFDPQAIRFVQLHNESTMLSTIVYVE